MKASLKPPSAGSPVVLSIGTKTMLPGGSNFGGSLRSPIHALKMSIQIGRGGPRRRGRPAPGAARAARVRGPGVPGGYGLFLAVAAPHAERQVRIEADEPGVAEVVGRAGLAGDRPV